MPRPKSKAAKASSEDRPAKRAKFLSDAESSDSDSEGANGVSLLNGRKTGTSELEDAAGFKINEEFARRFEHNKQREEKQRRRSAKRANFVLQLTIYSGGKVQR